MHHIYDDKRRACPRTAPPSHPTAQKPRGGDPGGARRITPVTADGSAPGGGVPNAAAALRCLGAAPFAATRFGVAVFYRVRFARWSGVGTDLTPRPRVTFSPTFAALKGRNGARTFQASVHPLPCNGDNARQCACRRSPRSICIE